MKVFVIINNAEMKMNVDVNAKNWLIKLYVIKDLFGILVIVSARSCDIGEYLDYENCKCRNKLVDKLVEECTEDIEETRLVEKTSAKS